MQTTARTASGLLITLVITLVGARPAAAQNATAFTAEDMLRVASISA